MALQKPFIAQQTFKLISSWPQWNWNRGMFRFYLMVGVLCILSTFAARLLIKLHSRLPENGSDIKKVKKKASHSPGLWKLTVASRCREAGPIKVAVMQFLINFAGCGGHCWWYFPPRPTHVQGFILHTTHNYVWSQSHSRGRMVEPWPRSCWIFHYICTLSVASRRGTGSMDPWCMSFRFRLLFISFIRLLLAQAKKCENCLPTCPVTVWVPLTAALPLDS